MRQRGRMDSVTAAVGDAAGVLRRRREGRQPYAKVYDAEGWGVVLDPASTEGQGLLSAAAALVDAVDARRDDVAPDKERK